MQVQFTAEDTNRLLDLADQLTIWQVACSYGVLAFVLLPRVGLSTIGHWLLTGSSLVPTRCPSALSLLSALHPQFGDISMPVRTPLSKPHFGFEVMDLFPGLGDEISDLRLS